MSDGPIALLAAKDLQFVAEAPGFEDLAAQTMGQLGTDQDGFDSILLEAATLLSSAPAVLTAIDEDLSIADAVLPLFDLTEGLDLLDEIEPAAAAADAALSDFNDAIGPLVDLDPAPPPPPSPPIGGPGGHPTPANPTPPPSITCIMRNGQIGVWVDGECMPLVT